MSTAVPTSTTLWATAWEADDHRLEVITGKHCTCDSYVYSSGSLDCPHHGEANSAAVAAEYEAECWAENAWLRAAEAPTADDYAFEQWEAARISPAEHDRAYGTASYC